VNKPSNPKDALGILKPSLSVVPSRVLLLLGLAMTEGARKYGRHNYRVVGVRASVYYDAALRHLLSYWEGETADPHSGLPHLVKAMASIAVLLDAEWQNRLTDDRPPGRVGVDMETLEQFVVELSRRYPDAKSPYIRKRARRRSTQ